MNDRPEGHLPLAEPLRDGMRVTRRAAALGLIASTAATAQVARGASKSADPPFRGDAVTPEDFNSFIDNDDADNQPALQAALDLAARHGCPVRFRARRYRTSRLIYRGQPLIGATGGGTVIRGMPGQDIFYAPDPSMNEPGSMGVVAAMVVRDLTVQVDNSTPLSLPSPDFDRPVYPVSRWQPRTNYIHDEWIQTSQGAIYWYRRSGRSGDVEPNHRSGLAIDGTATLGFIRDRQLHIGNVAFAFPLADAAKAAAEPYVISPIFENVTISNVGEDFANQSGSIYSARGWYDAAMALKVYKMAFGPAIVPPVANFERLQLAPDCNDWTKVVSHCRYPLFIFNAIFNRFGAFQAYGSGGKEGLSYEAAHENISILQYKTQTRDYTRGNVFEAQYFEGEGKSRKPCCVIMGRSHIFNGGGFTDYGSGPTVLYADACAFNNFFLGNNGSDAALEIWGDNNFGEIHAGHDGGLINDHGAGNEFRLMYTDETPFVGDRHRELTRPRRPARALRGDFALAGHPAAEMLNADDLFITPADISWNTPATQPAVTRTTDHVSGGFVTLAGEGQGNFQKVNSAPLIIGVNVPRCLCRVTFKHAAAQKTVQRLAIKTLSGLEREAAFELASDFRLNHFDVDFAEFAQGDVLLFDFYQSQAHVPVFLAWIHMRPIPVDVVRTVSADNSDADRVLIVGRDKQVQIWKLPLSANRAVTLSSNGAHDGACFRLVRHDGSGFDLVVNGVTRLSTAQYGEFVFDGMIWWNIAIGAVA